MFVDWFCKADTAAVFSEPKLKNRFWLRRFFLQSLFPEMFSASILFPTLIIKRTKLCEGAHYPCHQLSTKCWGWAGKSQIPGLCFQPAFIVHHPGKQDLYRWNLLTTPLGDIGPTYSVATAIERLRKESQCYQSLWHRQIVQYQKQIQFLSVEMTVKRCITVCFAAVPFLSDLQLKPLLSVICPIRMWTPREVGIVLFFFLNPYLV